MKEKRATDKQLDNFAAAFCPFGWLDIRAAVEHALDAGKDEDWAADQVKEFMESTETKIDNIDPVYCVLDSILQEARSEIDDITGFDIMNDMEGGGHIDTYGNYMASSFDYNEEGKKQLIQKLADNEIEIDDLQETTQYLLSFIDITQDSINAAMTSK